MQKLCITLLSLISAITSATDFGVADWGDSAITVLESESLTNLTPSLQSDFLVYQLQGNQLGELRRVYFFDSDRLVSGALLFRHDQTFTPAEAIEQFALTEQMISRQYGQEFESQVLTPLDELSQQNWSTALSQDQLILKNIWTSERTVIRQQLSWESGKPHHQVVYTPKHTE